MSGYSRDDEERIRLQDDVREWTRSGVLDAATGERLAGELRVDLRRTNTFLRAGLALFTFMIVAACVGLAISLLQLRGGVGLATATAIAAVACLAIAELLVSTYRLYRFGVEESLAVAAVVLLAFSAIELDGVLQPGVRSIPQPVAFLVVAAAGAYGLFRRFGFVYAAVSSMACAAAIPFQLHLSAAVERSLAAAVMSAVFAAARSGRRTHGHDFPGDDYGTLQAAAWAGIYLTLNVQVTGGSWHRVDGWFYWLTYAATWVLPAIGVWLAVRDRDRELMDVGIVMALATLVTSKPYLGWARNTWDPIVFGVALIVFASLMRRWLANGTNGERAGFTATRILDRDRAALSHLGTLAALTQQGVAPASAAPHQTDSAFGGGRSGGGGGGDRF